jgi:serine phosphatase RsbU (regulator of sigma subunit)
MSTAANASPALMPWKDPVQATIPEIRDGSMSAVYYGQRCSGDFYDFVRVNPQRVLFGLFDVAGLLQQTRKIVLAVQQEFRDLGTLLFQPSDANESESMLELWLHINSAVMKSASGVHSCPAFMACYNEQLGTLSYVNAGHTPGLVRDLSEIQELKATALVLRPGNTLVILSKGVVEAKHNGEEYGIERVSQYLRAAACETAHETCVGILSKVQQFMGTAPTHNDVTALALVRSN